jgi:hypothetical protein
MFQPKKNFLDSRQEFERNFNILSELINEKRLSFSIQASKSIESLMKIRLLPNKRLDLSTIDELARTTANMTVNMEFMHNPEEKNEKK